MLHPVGPRSPRVYWVRRTSVIVLAVLALIAAVFLVLQRGTRPTAGVSALTTSTSSMPSLTGVLATPTVSDAGAAGPGSEAPGLRQVLSGLSATGTSSTQSAATSAKPSATAGKPTPARDGSVTTTATSAPAKTNPAQTTPAKTTPAKTTPVKSSPVKSSPAQSSPAQSAPVNSTPSSSTPAKPTASTPPPVTTARTATPTSTPAAPTTDSQGRLLCPDASVTLRATTGAPAYRSGQQPVLGVTVISADPRACMRDLSGSLQVFSVYSRAGQRIWSTADCSPGVGTDVRQLQPQQALQYNIRWSGTTSAPHCAGDRLTVPPGHYQLRVGIGSLTARPVDFELT